MTPSLPHFLVLGAALFALGIFTAVTRRNAVGVLMGVELILNAANINFVAFNHYGPVSQLGGPVRGQAVALFVIVLAAAEAAVALAIVLSLYLNRRSIDVLDADVLKG